MKGGGTHSGVSSALIFPILFLFAKPYDEPPLEKLVYRRKLVYRHSFNILLFQSVAARQ